MSHSGETACRFSSSAGNMLLLSVAQLAQFQVLFVHSTLATKANGTRVLLTEVMCTRCPLLDLSFTILYLLLRSLPLPFLRRLSLFSTCLMIYLLTPSVQQQHVLESSASAEASGSFPFSWAQPNGRKLLFCLLLMYSLSVAYKSHGTEDCKRWHSRTWEGSGGGERWNAIKKRALWMDFS